MAMITSSSSCCPAKRFRASAMTFTSVKPYTLAFQSAAPKVCRVLSPPVHINLSMTPGRARRSLVVRAAARPDVKWLCHREESSTRTLRRSKASQISSHILWTVASSPGSVTFACPSPLFFNSW